MANVKGYVMFLAALAGAAIGWSLGKTIAWSITLPVDSALSRGQLIGTVLQYGGMAVGAFVAFVLAAILLKD